MPLDVPPGYRILKESDVAAYLANVPAVATELGGSAADWKIREVGDGNLNLVFIVRARRRHRVEAGAALCAAGRRELAAPSEPRLFRANGADRAGRPGPAHRRSAITTRRWRLSSMELLEPHIIMRKGMIAGTLYPPLANHIATFMARTLYSPGTSPPAADKKKAMGAFSGNAALCKITEDLVFTDPYRVAEANRWTSPQLDAIAAECAPRTAQSARLGAQAQVPERSRGDDPRRPAHGSVMVTETDTRAIDPEFAFYGPMGFDIGAVIANSSCPISRRPAMKPTAGGTRRVREWILETASHLDPVRAALPRAMERAAGGRRPCARPVRRCRLHGA